MPASDFRNSFIKKWMRSEKKLFLKSEMWLMDAPKFAEMSVEKVTDAFKADPKVKLYLPDKKEGCKRKLSRKFLFDIINTVTECYLEEVVQQQTIKRELAGPHLLPS